MKYLAEGQLISKAANSTIELLNEVMNAEYITRNVGHVLNFPATGESV